MQAANVTRPDCNGCKHYIDALLNTLQEFLDENEELTNRVAHLKTKNSEEKKRHSDTNNQIIMSNVKYQQALNQANNLLHKYVRERDEFMHKEATAAGVKAELETYKKANSQLIEVLKGCLGESASKSAVLQQIETIAKEMSKEPTIKSPKAPRALQVRTASELNSGSYLAAAAKTVKPLSKPKTYFKASVVPKPAAGTKQKASIKKEDSADADSDMSIDYGNDGDHGSNNDGDHDEDNYSAATTETELKTTKKATSPGNQHEGKLASSEKRLKKDASESQPKEQKSNNKEVANLLEQENEPPEGERKYRLRKSLHKGYAEPSLRTKLRRGDSHSNIIPDYVVRSYATPLHDNKENERPTTPAVR